MTHAEVQGMKLFRAKVWSPVDIALLKWTCIFLGLTVGAYLSDFIKHYVWVFLIAIILLGIKPTVSYFGRDQTDK
jgi:putative Mn2+ efflux pump MntP